MKINNIIRNAWNVFRGRDPTKEDYVPYYGYGITECYPPNRPIMNRRITNSILISIYNKIAIDVSEIPIQHVKTDNDGKYLETIQDGLNDILTLNANIDQTGREMIRDVVLTMLNDGCCAIVPTYTDKDALLTESYTVEEVRVGKILSWTPYDIIVELYNVETGKKERIEVPKRICAIIENPFYAVMNEPNATAQRLIKTLNQIDSANDESARGKFNLIIQAPWATATKTKKEMSKARKDDIEEQLSNSPHGIAYLDAKENIIQLNRPLSNDLWEQAKDLQVELYNQLGISKEVFDGTADEHQLLNYYQRVIYPIIKSITESMIRKWLSKTARSQNQSIMYFRDPFSSIPISNMAGIFDKMKSNEIMSSNECRSVLGLKPVNNDRANDLVNASINVQENVSEEKDVVEEQEEIQNE